jgi:hypothetical protein
VIKNFVTQGVIALPPKEILSRDLQKEGEAQGTMKYALVE